MTNKAREALEAAYRLLSNIDFDEDSDLDDMAAPVIQKIGHALAEPIRNCDVGTVEEQHARYDKFCNTQKHCNECPCYSPQSCQSWCAINWAQLPYKEGNKNEQ